jgi:hypothetical protein
MSAFFYRGPLPPDSPLFRGRKAELSQLIRLCQGEVQAYAIIYGGRQTGKTSLLLRLAAMLPKSVRTCRVDMQRIPGATLPQVCNYLAQSLVRSLPGNDQTYEVVPMHISPTMLRQILAEYFNESELRDLCFEMEIGYEDLAGPGLRDKARELVIYCERRGRTDELVRRCHELRPKASWPASSSALEQSRSPHLAAANKVNDAPTLIEFLCQTVSRPEVDRFVLLLEELGALPQSVQEDLANIVRSIFNSRFDSYCRPLARLVVMLAGSVELYQLAATQVSTLHNICEEIYLPDLSEQESVGLIADALASLGVQRTNTETLGRAIYAHAGGHPYLTQRLGGSLEQGIATGEPLAPAYVDRAVEQLLLGDPLLHHLHKALGEQNLLAASESLLGRRLRFSRLDEEMARLELLGLARESGGRWAVRNRLLEKVLQEWTTVPPNPAQRI